MDMCTRLCQAQRIPDREPHTFIKVLTNIWFRPFGAPKVLEHDEEGAFTSALVTKWLSDVQVTLVLKPKNTHTWMVERHHDILRQLYVRIRYQAQEEGIQYDDDDILAMAVMAKNCMITVGQYSPQTAVFGTTWHPPGPGS